MKTQTKKMLFTFIAWFAFTTMIAQPNDVAAIKEVISKETEAFFGVNKQSWADCWHQVPYAYWSYSDSTATSFVQGWQGDKGLEKTFEQYFKTAKPSKAVITRDWLDIKIFGNGAYARYFQNVKDEIEHDVTSEMRVLEKINGKWKVICVGAIAKYPNVPTVNH
ncbi:hypothetical protein WSM22_28300 [Cytophagales bacterium WSM2-2]|nr:hypothetical protein WSM22_28300 [Cytophagales bacterium WSM2-2]